MASCLCCILLQIFTYVTYNYASLNKYYYDTRHIEVPLDHFNFASDKKFLLRYLINDTNVERLSPIFFYTGNEGNVELFAQNTGFLWDLANKYKAAVVFAEHRFYGKSLPFGIHSFNDTSHYGYLNVEQALADYAHLIANLRGDRDVPVIAFGGSYGGMLAAWLRMKYPHLVNGALASSAPLWQFNKLTSCDIFAKIVTSVYNTSYSVNCTLNIRRSWDVLTAHSSTADGRLKLQKVFNFCKQISEPEDINAFLDYLEDVYNNMAMANYPYDNDFLAPLPAFPVQQFCYYLKDYENQDLDLLNALKIALNVYTNSSEPSKCLNYTSAYNNDLGGVAWDIQTCNELVMPMCSAALKSSRLSLKKMRFCYDMAAKI